MIYFIADTHFGHENILKLSQRPFNNIQEHDETLIHNWNNIIHKKDEVYILGDLVMSNDGQYANQLLAKLNGKKYLIVGNHDDYLNDPKFNKSLFEWIKPYHEFKYNHIRFVLFHYPILEWNGFYKNTIHLYGHVHNTNVDYFRRTLDKRALNVGVDMTGFRPISIDEVIETTKKPTI